MITKWGQNYINTPIAGTNPPIPNIATTYSGLNVGVVPLKNISGSNLYGKRQVYTNRTDLITSTITNTTAGFAVGSGNSSPTDTDYNIEQLITDLTGSVAISGYFDDTDYSYHVRATITLNNNTATDITVKEVARFVTIQTSTVRGSNADTTSSMMIFRNVLETPLVVPHGESSVLRLDFIYSADV